MFTFYVFRRAPCPALFLKVKNAPCLLLKFKIAPCPFLEGKNTPCLFSEMKKEPCPFSTISRDRKLDSCRKSENATWKVRVQKNSCTQNSRFCIKTPFCFYLEKHLIKEVNNFWCRDRDCASTATHSSEKFNTRMFLNIYFKIAPLLPQKCLIWPLTAISFLHEKVLTERVGLLLMTQSELCVDCYRIRWGIQLKGSLKHF